jgi:hypothetical protein
MKLSKVELKQNHNLKILPQYFEAVAKGLKTFEIVFNDRDYKIGDRIILMEFDGNTYTGREVAAEITFMTNYEQKPGYIVFSFRKYSVTNRKDVGKFERGYKKGVL